MNVRYGPINEHGVDWPSQGEDGLYHQSVPSLPPRLLDELVSWANEVHTNYLVEAGWPTEAAARSQIH